ncbi:MAG: energy-coupling factor ABC transporter ATP-binding protein [Xanthobacter sp.]
MSTCLSLRDIAIARDGAEILRHVTFDLSGQERLAIIGSNGAGKTTLLRTIVGLERPAHGSIHLFGEECGQEKAFRKFRPRIGFLFQDSDDQLFCPTVLEDVSFGPLNIGCTDADATVRAHDALEELGIGHLAERTVHRLSGGEKRLVCLAGLLAMRPDVLMLDEPTNGVDAQNGARLREALRAFPGAMLLVSHDEAFISELATRAMVIQHGKLVAAQVHQHPHTHSHLHVHPEPE